MRTIHAALLLAAVALSGPVGGAPAADRTAKVATLTPAHPSTVERLRTRAYGDDWVAQWRLAEHLADAYRRGAGDSALVEATFWLGRVWQTPWTITPDTLAAYVRANCGEPAIARHWICTDGE